MADDSALLWRHTADTTKNFPLWPLHNFNHNVVLNWIASALQGCGDSIWNGTVMAAFIYDFVGSDKGNSYVGYVEAAQGMAILIVALPVGWLADKTSKSAIVRFGSLLIPVASAATIFGVTYAEAHESQFFTCYWILFGAMCIWGVAYAIFMGPSQALLADSTPIGQRSWYFTRLAQLNMVARATGPIVAIILFYLHGDRWEPRTLRNVLVVGVAIDSLMTLPMLFMRDDCALDEVAEPASDPTGAPASTPVSSHGVSTAAGGSAIEGDAIDGGAASDSPQARRRLWLVPYISFGSGLLFSFGSGMTVKFFPLFFKNDLQLSPVWVQVIYLLSPLVMAVSSGIAERASRVLGRVTVVVLFNFVGILLLVVLMVTIYIARTVLMNCTQPIEDALLMDYVPKETRARWKSLDSIMMFGWCGSAAVGGIIADKYDYSTTFLATATFQASGTAVYAYLCFIIPHSRDVENGSESPPSADGPLQRQGAGSRTAPADVLVEPLVAGSIQQALPHGTDVESK